jgi:hypothetical protein
MQPQFPPQYLNPQTRQVPQPYIFPFNIPPVGYSYGTGYQQQQQQYPTMPSGNISDGGKENN